MKTIKNKEKVKSARLVTFELLRNRPACMTLNDVAIESGLPLSWLKSFHIRGNKFSASIDKVEKLYQHLTGKTFV